MTDKYTFDCGCQVDILEDKEKKSDGLPSLYAPFEEMTRKLNYERGCEKAWELIGTGKTTGVFQLEGDLGHDWGAKLQPHSLEEMCALISLIRPACISGDTKIVIDRGKRKTYKYLTMRELYNSKQTHIFSLDEQTGKYFKNEIKKIILTGEKECFRVNCIKGFKKKNLQPHYSLECTADHKLMTHRGWIELQHINPGDRILVTTYLRGTKPKQEYIKSRHHPEIKVKNCDGIRHYKEICYQNYLEKCIFCDWNEASLDVHHIDGNSQVDNSPENLCFVCPNHHRQIEAGQFSKDQILQAREHCKLPQYKDTEWVEFVSAESVGLKDVYDISMAGPNHNFIAGHFVVHNCLEGSVGGKSITEKYVDRKHNKEESRPDFECLGDILKDTYHLMIYQENAIKLASELAGFNLIEADTLRAACGKKKIDLMAKIKPKFIEGCLKNNVLENDSEQIWDWIEKSQRYSFNKCLSGNTICKIRQNYDKFKYIHIRDIQTGDYVYSPSITTQGGTYFKVKNKFHQGVKLCYQYYFDNGKHIECTEDHKFLTEKDGVLPIKEIVARNLTVGNYYTGRQKVVYWGNPVYIETYDIEIDSNDHIFYGNGLPTSNSHGISYGAIGYLTAWAKYHFPLHFYTALITKESKDKKDTRRFISDAKLNSIDVLVPTLKTLFYNNSNMCVDNDKIRFGIKSIKNIGDANIQELEEKLKNVPMSSWTEFALNVVPHIRKQTINGLITGGVLDCYRVDRVQMLHEATQLKKLTKKQVETLKSSGKNTILECLAAVVGTVNKGQKEKISGIIDSIENPPYVLKDTPGWIIRQEKDLYGIAITYNPIDELTNKSYATHKCKDVHDAESGEFLLCGEITSLRKWTIKSGKNIGKEMCKFVLNDENELELVVFNKQFEEYKNILFEGNFVHVSCWKKDNSVIANEIEEIF